MQVEKLLNHIARVTIDNQRNSFDLKTHFIYPQSPVPNFLSDLKKEPLLCAKDHPQNILEEVSRKYQARDQVVSTQAFIVEIEAKVEKLKEKNLVFAELRKQTQRKN
jgi:hypothetical protein